MMRSADVLNPLVMRGVYAPEYATAVLDEIRPVVRKLLNPDSGTSHEHYMRQCGFPIPEVNPKNLPSVFKIIQALEMAVGYRCDPFQSSIRQQAPLNYWPRLAWHQDISGMEIGMGEDAIIIWVPLDPLDGTRPTIEFANVQDGVERPHVRDAAWFLIAKNPDDIMGGPIVNIPGTPVKDLRAGDVVAFSPLTLHRTYFDSHMTVPRSSMDLRFFGARTR